jgi:hypothetical protein
MWVLGVDGEGNAAVNYIASLEQHTTPVNCVRFSPSGAP